MYKGTLKTQIPNYRAAKILLCSLCSCNKDAYVPNDAYLVPKLSPPNVYLRWNIQCYFVNTQIDISNSELSFDKIVWIELLHEPKCVRNFLRNTPENMS